MVVLLCLLVGTEGRAEDQRNLQDKAYVPLTEVIAATEDGLNSYQVEASRRHGRNGCVNFPPLKSADFTFKTIVRQGKGWSVNLFVLTLSTSHENVRTTQIDFEYVPHATTKSRTRQSVTLSDQIVRTLEAASREVLRANLQSSTDSNADGVSLDLNKVFVTIAYGVTTNRKDTMGLQFKLIALSTQLHKEQNNVQEVKLGFKADGGPPLCNPEP
jgi:hypothetical protein